jgi:DNA mismatch endonuclease (patch repair protein)
MADVFNRVKRSAVMRAIRSKGNRDTEVKLANIFRSSRITGWRRHQMLPGRPDFIFRSVRLAVFVDGCFWHGCPLHGRKPDSNRGYWLPKLLRNKARDRAVARNLRKIGWNVLRIWEHDLKNPAKVTSKIRLAIERAAKRACERGSFALTSPGR